MDVVLLALLAYVVFGTRRPNLKVIDGGAPIVEQATAAANLYGVPPRIVVATVLAESNAKHLGPRGSGEGKTFYPGGLQRNRGRDVLRRMGHDPSELTAEFVDAKLADLDTHMRMLGHELARGWATYPGDDERMRVFWVAPGVAKAGRPWEGKWSGSVPWSRRLSRWQKKLDEADRLAPTS
jgi:hypothetical protein